MKWGDKIPFESATIVAGVGNGPNASVSAARLGLSSSLLVWLGKDRNGDDCIAALKENGVMTDLIVPDESIDTNQHYVLWYESERSILIKHNAFPYRIPENFPAPEYLYLTSLGEAAGPLYEDLKTWLPAHPEVKLVFQPGTFQIRLGTDVLKFLYERSELVVCNKEEAKLILKTEEDDIKKLLGMMLTLSAKKTVITDGRNGAYATDGTGYWFVPMYPDEREPVERTGAGDAFASTVAVALGLGNTFEQALLWGPINSMAVVQEIGAQKGLLTRDQIENYLREAPAEYALTSL